MRRQRVLAATGVLIVAAGAAADVRPVQAGAARRADPARVAGARLLPGGGWERTTAWMPYAGGAADEDVPYYASMELDGGQGCGDAGGYVFLDADKDPLNFPYTATNMRVPDVFMGHLATGVDLMYWWTDNGTGNDWYIAVFTAEDVSTDCSPPAYENVYEGVVLSFSPLPTGYWYTSARGLDAYGLFIQMPYDQGAWILTFGATEGDPLGPVQEVAYGTSNNGGSPARPGESTDPTWSDRDGDGQFAPDTECLSYALGLYPDPLTTGINFWGQPSTPPWYTDCNEDRRLDVFDFLCFINRFNDGDAYADCDGSGDLDLFDFLCFVNCYFYC